jgi:hypothetical protein
MFLAGNRHPSEYRFVFAANTLAISTGVFAGQMKEHGVFEGGSIVAQLERRRATGGPRSKGNHGA